MRFAPAVILPAICFALALAAPALADTSAAAQRTFGWEIFSRPGPVANAPPAVPGHQTLPGQGWVSVYVPASYSPDRPAPLALLLHGSGDRGRTMIDAFQSLADRHGVILVAPNSRRYSWDIMVEGAHLKNTTQVPDWGDDVGRIDAALGRAFELYAVDRSRVALIGFSDGAGYGLSLGTNNADLFSDVIAFAPGLLMRVDGHARSRVFLAHGDDDRVLPPDPTREIFAPVLDQLGFDVTLELFDGRHEMPAGLRAQAMDWWLKPGLAARTQKAHRPG